MAERDLPAPDTLWTHAARWVEAAFGLHFPERVAADLRRGMEAAARRLGLADGAACARRALAGELGADQLEVVAECLAIGETYFFRDPELFLQLGTQVLEPLIAARRRSSRHLRLWSAGCSTGEEPWSLAMLVASLLPEWRQWDIRILGTDVNAASLRKARGASYGRWSLRGGLPRSLQPFLQEGADGRHHVDPHLRRIVRFEHLNLAGTHYPSAATATTDMDLVLCRNVLIYFAPGRARSVLERLGRSLAAEGWLVPGSVEIPAAAIPGLGLVHAGGLFALRRSTAIAAPSCTAVAPANRPAPPGTAAVAPAVPLRLAPAPRPPLPPAAEPPAEPLLEQARHRANAGDLAGAERLCRQAVARDKLDPDCTYLLATILAERGAAAEAMTALQRTLYLDPDHVLARFNLGSLALRQGQRETAQRHLANALTRLAGRPAEEVVQGGGGLTARELQEAIRRAEVAAR